VQPSCRLDGEHVRRQDALLRFAIARGCSAVAVHAIEQIARALEWIGTSAIVVGSVVTAWVSVAAYRTSGSAAAIRRRQAHVSAGCSPARRSSWPPT
jgi:uncharacterized membrane protein (DUF4010 family)